MREEETKKEGKGGRKGRVGGVGVRNERKKEVRREGKKKGDYIAGSYEMGKMKIS